VIHTYNPSTREAKAGGSQVPDQPGLHSEMLSQNKERKKNIKNYFKNTKYIDTE
jgi:hypothetical protein